MDNETPTAEVIDEAAIREALNTHGIFFKKAVRREIEGIKGVTVLGEEYPVRYMEGAALDLLVEVRAGDNRLILPMECKRAYVRTKRWVFFQDPDPTSKVFYEFSGKLLRAQYGSAFEDVCIEGVEIEERRKNDKRYLTASPEPIWEAARQTCKGYLGFVQQELVERRKPRAVTTDRLLLMPVLVTTAPLFIAEVDLQAIDLSTGNLNAPLPMRSVPGLVLRHPFTPSYAPGEQHLRLDADNYIAPAERGAYQKESILVVSADHLREVFHSLTDRSGADEESSSQPSQA
jgi:hypothetical protein